MSRRKLRPECALYYCNGYDDLQNSLCGGGECTTEEHAVLWRSSDQGLTWGPRTFRSDLNGRDLRIEFEGAETLVVRNAMLIPEEQDDLLLIRFLLQSHGDAEEATALAQKGREDRLKYKAVIEAANRLKIALVGVE